MLREPACNAFRACCYSCPYNHAHESRGHSNDHSKHKGDNKVRHEVMGKMNGSMVEHRLEIGEDPNERICRKVADNTYQDSTKKYRTVAVRNIIAPPHAKQPPYHPCHSSA